MTLNGLFIDSVLLENLFKHINLIIRFQNLVMDWILSHEIIYSIHIIVNDFRGGW